MAFNRAVTKKLSEMLIKKPLPQKSPKFIQESLQAAIHCIDKNPLLTTDGVPHGQFFKSSYELMNYWLR